MNDPLIFLSYALAATVVLLVSLALLRRWRREAPDPAELERRRRLHLNRIGRIVEGRIIEITDELVESERADDLLAYNYKVRGVEYQAAQDIGSLRERLGPRHLSAGQPAQVKYDPQNPTNSIVVCEEWSGI